MGIEVVYNRDQLKKLPQDKITKTKESIYRGPIYTPEELKENPEMVVDEQKYTVIVEYVFFDGVLIGHAPPYDDYLCFDNKAANAEGRAILDKYGIDYVIASYG